MSDNQKVLNPKVFISYCWGDEEYQDWVVKLCGELRRNGVDVVLDLWHLKEGNDANAFMERMVVDAEITNVLCLCDKKYTEKSSNRVGGVGTEAMIISPKLYREVEQSKFIPIVVERDDHGNEFVPPFFDGRIYIDLSDRKFGVNFEKLIRALFKQPKYKIPELGTRPSYLVDTKEVNVVFAQHEFARFSEEVLNNSRRAIASLKYYLEAVFLGLEKMGSASKNTALKYQEVEGYIAAFVPIREQVLQCVTLCVRYLKVEEYVDCFHAFFERMLCLSDPLSSCGTDKDHIKYISYELFLYVAAVLIHERQAEFFEVLVERRYCYPLAGNDYDDGKFSVFRQHIVSLEEQKRQAEGSNQISYVADVLKEHNKDSLVSFELLVTADVVLMLRSVFQKDGGFGWDPKTHLYTTGFRRLEFFYRAKDEAGFQLLANFLGVKSRSDLRTCFDNNVDVISRMKSRKAGYLPDFSSLISLDDIT